MYSDIWDKARRIIIPSYKIFKYMFTSDPLKGQFLCYHMSTVREDEFAVRSRKEKSWTK